MEENIEIPTPDGCIIYGTLNYDTNRHGSLIIFAHALSGNCREHQYSETLDFLEK